MDKINALIGRFFEAVAHETKLTIGVVTVRGVGRFGRAIVIAGCIALGAYQLVYVPAAAKEQLYADELDAAKLVAQYEDQYKALEERIASGVPLLAPTREKEGWLSKAILATLNKEHLEPDMISAGGEKAPLGAGVIVQDATVKFKVPFKNLVAWLEEVEKTRPALFIDTLHMAKLDKPIGVNQVDCTVDAFFDVGAQAAGPGVRR